VAAAWNGFELTETRSRFEFVDGPSGDELDDSINAVGLDR
jgi:hypothetical protein